MADNRLVHIVDEVPELDGPQRPESLTMVVVLDGFLDAGNAAARAAHIAGFDASSNLEAGRRWGVPTMGTAAHSFTLLHDSEEDAFRAQVETLGTGTTLLIDTFDVERGVERGAAPRGDLRRAHSTCTSARAPLLRKWERT